VALRPRHAVPLHEGLECAARLLRHLGIMVPDLFDRQRHPRVERIELDHGREQSEPLHVAVELAGQQQGALQDRRQEGMLLGRNKDALHGVSLILWAASKPSFVFTAVHALRRPDATPGETTDAKTEYKSRMPEPKTPEPLSGPQPGRWVLGHGEIRTIVFGLMLAMFLAALNQTIVATALPTIGRDFRDFELLPWVVTAYLLSSTVVAPLYGKLSDIHGRRAMMLAAVGIFTAGSVACALATDMIMLILGRALQGIGGGGILPLAQSILADAVAPRERGHYQAYMGSVWVTAGLGGPVVGGILAEHFHWSIIFWFNVPLGLVAAAMAHRSLRRLPRHDRKHKLDLLGAGLMT